MPTIDQARQYAAILKEHAQPERLLRVLVFGSIAQHQEGHDLDIIVEVTEEVFLEFAKECVGALDGYHPIQKLMLPMYSMRWDYESPEDHRRTNALEAIGITSEDVLSQLHKCVSNARVDMLCLPKRWEEPNYADGLLAEAFGFRKDPKMLAHIKEGAVEL